MGLWNEEKRYRMSFERCIQIKQQVPHHSKLTEYYVSMTEVYRMNKESRYKQG